MGTLNTRAIRWLMGVGLAAMVGMGLVLLFLLTVATNNRDLYEQNYQRLFAINVGVAGLLLVTIAWIALRLWMRLRQGRFGSRLLVRLAAVFALAGFAPGLLIYFVSYQFVARSIESWFDVKVEGALDAGVNLGRVTLDTLSSEFAEKTRVAANQIADASDTSAGLLLERLREQLRADDVLLLSSAGTPISTVGMSRFQINTERPTGQQMRTARSLRSLGWIEGLEEVTGQTSGVAPMARVKALALVSSSRFDLRGEQRFLLTTQTLPATLVANALAVAEANREYQERALARNGLKRMYIGTLTLSLFLAVFGAVLLAVLIGNRIARPLLVLADGVRQVAAGDLTPKAALQSSDELGGLTRSFADMTQQLADARQAVERSMSQLDDARSRLQTILDNLTAGVIVLDAEGRILSTNPGATRILRVPLAAFEGRPLSDVDTLHDFAANVRAQFSLHLGDRATHGLDHWQQSFELGRPESGMAGSAAQDTITLIARGALLPDGTRLVVFDDISEVVSAQRSLAWGEVARRLAHEIKNPLTPIQLSAERMQMKLGQKLEGTDQALLNKSVRTIVDQVEAMKRLVNEFRDYARLPHAELKPLDLNQLVAEIAQLYAPENATVPVQLELDPTCPAIAGDAQQLRQVVHNLLQNAQDATLANPQPLQACVILRTRYNPQAQRVRLSVLDHGTGFPDNILARAFEPYVTTKAKGTGLGLAVVKKIADEHASRVEIVNRQQDGQPVGAQVSISFAIIVEANRNDDASRAAPAPETQLELKLHQQPGPHNIGKTAAPAAGDTA
jgi:nitrogen fixation/metabolism regulation signal transduction histidine kinase